VKGIALAHPSEISHIDAHFFIWERAGMCSIFVGSSPGYGFPSYFDLAPIQNDRFRLIDNRGIGLYLHS
jgi:hypothetical protein